MNQLFFIVTTIIVVASLGVYVSFVRSEGSDERGREILARSGIISFIFLCLGFAAQGLYFTLATATVEAVQLLISTWMAFVFGSYSISILYYRKRI
jgi:hypothetical protein